MPANPFGGELYQINLQTKDPKMEGKYIVTLKTSLFLHKKVAPVFTTFEVIINNNHPPYFKSAITPMISIQMTNTKENWFYKLPLKID